MHPSSIDVVESVLGASLTEKRWAARSIAEIDMSDPVYRVPAISEAQYRDMQSRLVEHWTAQREQAAPHNGRLLIFPRLMTPLHQHPDLMELSWRLMIPRLVKADDAVIARKALLYSEGVVLRDPTELMAPTGDNEGWEDRWKSAFYQLAMLDSLVRAGCVQLYPLGAAQQALVTEPNSDAAKAEREHEAELSAFYRSPQWGTILQRLPFASKDDAAVYASWALGQFAFKNVVLPDATPWLPSKECLLALEGLEEGLEESDLAPDVLAVARLSSQVGVDLTKVSDEDIITLHGNEELFSTWRRLVAELCLEVERLGIERATDVRTLVQAKQALWRAELERNIGKGGVLSGVFDASAIACGVIKGGVAAGTGMSAAATVVSAFGGGLATPLVKLFGNLVGRRGSTATERAVAAHFMALEG